MRAYLSKDASISECGQYRYLLSRVWRLGVSGVTWIMLNPSTADANLDDPTITRCVRLSDSWGYGSINILNLYAYRTSKPKDLKAVGYPVGPDNDTYIETAVPTSPLIVCAWGNNAQKTRAAQVTELIRGLGGTPTYLRMSKTGNPWHPLYLPVDISPKAMP